jgi:Zn-dependent M28 family amino/carboxypeptidase
VARLGLRPAGDSGGYLQRVQPGPSDTVYGYNVVAVLPGSDPKLAGEYVAFGAHLDHVGVRRQGAVDHDSIVAFNAVVRPMGADDDGSGSVALMELAERFARDRVAPKRSLLFVWHTGEEYGMVGSRWYTDHPTVPLDAIVTQLNIDMIGRGTVQDLPAKGGPQYVELIGSKRLSSELGALVEEVNRKWDMGFRFNYEYDAAGHPEQYYCRSDHYMYARFGIPVTFFSTGSHRDYHMVTDEAQYIDYRKLQRVTSLIGEVGLAVANLDHRPVVDGPKPDPRGRCVQ